MEARTEVLFGMPDCEGRSTLCMNEVFIEWRETGRLGRRGRWSGSPRLPSLGPGQGTLFTRPFQWPRGLAHKALTPRHRDTLFIHRDCITYRSHSSVILFVWSGINVNKSFLYHKHFLVNGITKTMNCIKFAQCLFVTQASGCPGTRTISES